MAYAVHDKAETANGTLDNVKVDFSSFEDVIRLDDKPLNLGTVAEKLKTLITEAKSELDDTKNVEE